MRGEERGETAAANLRNPPRPVCFAQELEDFALGEFGNRPAGTTPQALARFRCGAPPCAARAAELWTVLHNMLARITSGCV